MWRAEHHPDKKGVYSPDFPCNFKGAVDPGSGLYLRPVLDAVLDQMWEDTALLAFSLLLPSLSYSHGFRRCTVLPE